MNILYIGRLLHTSSSGAEQIDLRNQLLLEKMSGGNITYLPIGGGKVSSYFNFGISNGVLNSIACELNAKRYDYIFISHSLYGRVCKFIHKKRFEIKTISFFHNIEIFYGKEYLRNKGAKAFPFYLLAKYWEKQCCKYSDFFITLNGRDSALLKKYYGKSATIELPTSIKDKFNEEIAVQVFKSAAYVDIDYLFVGVAFFANVEAVQWFIDNVLPYVKGVFCVVGKGMDKVKFRNLSERVKILGYVDDLSYYYYKSKMVVSPIFSGAGMKTKTAEALMYGKTILGTKEAFEGYEVDEKCMHICNSGAEYVKTINELQGKEEYINRTSRSLYLAKYSYKASISVLQTIFARNMRE